MTDKASYHFIADEKPCISLCKQLYQNNAEDSVDLASIEYLLKKYFKLI